MRTLKKTLCLVLCLAMMVGLCAIGANAVTYDDYKDKDKINYEGAVKLLTALGVLEGDSNGFRPQDELTRAEGAAIMTRLLGKDVPDGTSSFSDMAGYGWAQKYVKFCEDYGIIAGYGNGKFGPGDKLTTSQFAKMLIVALGYDAEKEGMVNTPAWEINTTKKVTSLNLGDGLAAYLPGKNIQREQAAQLAYNTLLQPMVYAEGSSIAVSWVGNLLAGGDAILTVKEGAVIPNTSYDYNTNNDIDNVLEFCEAVFPELKLRTADDVYAIPTNYWFKGKNAQDKTFSAKKVIAETIAVPVLATYTGPAIYASSADVYNDAGFGSALFGANTAKIDTYENGTEVEPITVTSKGTAPVLAGYAGAEAILLDMSKLYEQAGADNMTRLVVKYPYLAQVIAVIPGETRSVTLKVFRDIDEAITVNFETDEFKKGDFVLAYAAGAIWEDWPDGNDGTKFYDAEDFEEALIEVKAAEAKNGTLKTVTLSTKDDIGKATKLTIGTETLSIGSDNFAVLGPEAGYGVRAPKVVWNINTGLTAFMANGFILGVIPDSIAYGDWVFVVGHDGHGVGSPWNDKLDSFVVGYVNQEAKRFETKSYVAKGTEPEVKYWTTVDEGTLTDKADVYDVNKDCELTKGLKHDQPELGVDAEGNKIIADSKTVFILNTGKGFKAYTGIHDVPDYNVKGTPAKAYALVPSKGAHAIAVYVDVSGMDPVVKVQDADPVYLLGLYPGKKTDDNGTVVYTYAAIIDGKLGELKAKNPKKELEVEGLVIPVYDAKGYVTGVKSIADDPAYILLNAADTKCTFLNDTITFGDNTYAVAKDAVAYIYNRNTGKLTTATVDTLPGLPAADVTAIATAKDKTIRTIYYVYPSKLA